MCDEFQSLSFEGSGKCRGGKYNNVNISGSAEVNQDIECNNIEISGNAKIKGNVKAKKLEVSGVNIIKGCLNTLHTHVSGILKVRDNFNSNDININGIVKSNNIKNTEAIEGEGTIEVKYNINTKKINFYGVIECEGDIECEDMNLKLFGVSRVNSVKCNEINIESDNKTHSKIFKVFKFKKLEERKVFANKIESNHIKIENCEANLIKGDTVIIGKNCNIKKVEYTSDLQLDSLSNVDDIVNLT